MNNSYLSIDMADGRSGVEGAKQIVGAPPDELSDMVVLPDGLVLGAVLDHRPAEQRHGEGHREVELDVVAGVVVAANEAALDILGVGAVRQAGVPAPRDAVVLRKPAGCHQEEGSKCCQMNSAVSIFPHFLIRVLLNLQQ